MKNLFLFMLLLCTFNCVAQIESVDYNLTIQMNNGVAIKNFKILTEVTQVTLYKYVSMIIFDKWRTNYWTFIATISY